MIKNNPIFLQSFQQNKLTQSVKLTDFRNANIQVNNQQFIRDSNAPMSQHQKIQQNSQKSYKMMEVGSGQRSLMQNMKQIKTQYSQISGVQTGFKKLKGNQIQTLKELRNQYQVLKNLQAEDNQRERSKKMVQSSSSSISHRDSVSSSSQSRPSSVKQYPKDTNFKQQKLWNVQRKQYELIISNCQQKIQELLHTEMQYKKAIYELKNMSNMNPNIKSNTKVSMKTVQQSEQIKELQRTERDTREKIIYLQTQLQKAKAHNKQLNERVIKLQDQLTVRDQDANRLEEEKKKLQDLIRLQKDKYMTNQIEKKKIQMEYEILQRDKSHQTNRLLRQLQHRQAVAEQDLKFTIKRLEQEIQIKDNRYSLLLNQLENKRKEIEQKDIERQRQFERQRQKYIRQQPKKDQNLALQAFNKFLSEGRASNNNEELIKVMNNILMSLQKNERKEVRPVPNNNNMENQRLFGEIRLLKAQIQSLRNSKNDSFDVQPIKRAYESQINSLKENISMLQQKLRRARKSPQSSPSFPKSPSQSSNKSLQIMRLNKRIEELENLVNQKQSYIKQQQQYIFLYKNRQQKSQNQIRTLKRRGDQFEFQLQKLRKQGQFNISMVKRQNQTNMRIKNAELAKAHEGINYWKNEFEKVKRFYEQKIAQKNRIIQSSQTVEITTVKSEYDEKLQYAKKEYEQQISQLAQKLSNYQQGYGSEESWKKKCLNLQNSLYDLRKYNQKSRQLNQGIDHLWSIKEAEYNNVNHILKSVDYRF